MYHKQHVLTGGRWRPHGAGDSTWMLTHDLCRSSQPCQWLCHSHPVCAVHILLDCRCCMHGNLTTDIASCEGTDIAAAQILKSACFMQKHADLQATTARDGYNPVLLEFSNASFWLASSNVQ